MNVVASGGEELYNMVSGRANILVYEQIITYTQRIFMNKDNLEVLQALFPKKALIESDEVKQAFGISAGTLASLVRNEKIPYIKFGGAKSTLRFDIVAIAKWIEESGRTIKVGGSS